MPTSPPSERTEGTAPTSMRPILLVTRPQPQADAWVRELRTHGVPAHALPLLQIEANAQPAAHDAWRALERFALVVFVSPNAVQLFYALRAAGAQWPAATLAGSTGPGTTQALLDSGVPPAQIVEPAREAARFDSEALWQRLRHRSWAGAHVLVVRGDGGREWLGEQLRDAGAQIQFVRAYRRVLPQWSSEQQALAAQALAAPQRVVWLLSSSQAVQHLRRLLPDATWSLAVAWATHERIVQAARAAGFGNVHGVAPTQQAVLALWGRSIQFSAPPDAPSAQRP
jgi:uroporphyrinogen-III synthase